MTYSVLGIDTQTSEQVVVSQSARRQGLYIIGATGTGKTGLIENFIIQDIKQGLGVGLLDPHGDLTNAVLSRLPDTRVVDGVKRLTEEDVILLDIKNTLCPFGLNLFSCSDPSDLVALTIASAHVMHIFRKLWGKGGILVEDAWGVLLEKILENATLTLLENPGYTMAEIPLLLNIDNPSFRKKLIQNLMSDAVRDFWEHDFATLPSKDQRQETQSTLNRVNSFLRQQLVRNIIGQSRTTIDFRSVMDERKILLVRLNVRLGEGITTLLGTMILAGILDAAYSRADMPVNKRKQFNLYADEFQRFASEDFATLLTEARKYGIATTIAHQMRNQLDTQNRGATLNVANLVVFKISGADATELAGEFDLTPQEAWEEEIEKERVEVLRPQQHERIEEQVEVEVEEDVMEILHTPFDHLKRNSHGSAKVREAMQALSPFLPPSILLLSTDNELNEITWCRGGGSLNIGFGEKTDIDSLLIDVMEDRLALYSLALAERIKKIVLYDAPSIGWLGHRHFNAMNSTYEGYNERYGINLTREDYEKYVGRLRRETEGQPEIYMRLSALIWGLVSGQGELNKLKQDLADVLFDLSVRGFAETTYCMSYIGHISRETNKNRPHDDITLQRIKDNWSVIEKNLASEEKKCEEKIQKAKQRLPEWTPLAVDGLVTYINHLLTLCEELAKEENHILVPTGQKRMVKRIQPHITYLTHESEKITIPRKTIMHPQRSYADVLNEVASQLANLPAFTARAKIATGGKPIEYTIRTLEPERGLDRTALQERVERIQARNRDDGYIRLRQEVEAEIRTRQNQWREPPEPPPITRRHQ
jgi:hypothetical protein